MKALEKTKELNAVSVYGCNAVDKIINDIREEVSTFVFDVHTTKGRSAIASLAHKVARSKTALDRLGKDLVSEWKEKARLVDQERKKVRDEFDKIKQDVRRPLDEWEAEQARLAEQQRIEKEILESWDLAIVENKAFDLQKELDRKEAEEQAREAARLAKEEEERLATEQAEREAKIKQEAAEAATREAEAKAQAEKDRLAREAFEAKLKEEQAKQQAEAAKQREIEAAKKAEADKIAAQKQAELDKQNAIKAEQARVRQEEAAKAEAERKRLANKAHCKRINNEALNSLVAIGVDKEMAKKIITHIALNEIKHVVIGY